MINSNFNKIEIENEFTNYGACLPIVNGSREVREIAEKYSTEKCRSLSASIFMGVSGGATLANSACHAINSYVALTTPKSSSVNVLLTAGAINTLVPSSFMGLAYAGSKGLITLAPYMKDVILFGGPTAIFLSGLGLCYTAYSYATELPPPPTFDDIATLGSSIALGAMGGIGMTYNNWNYSKKARLAERMNDIYYSSLYMIILSIKDTKDGNLENKFIRKIIEEEYVQNWDSTSFQLNAQRFDEFNSFNEGLNN